MTDGERKAFLSGVCVALHGLTDGIHCGVTWGEIVRSVGVDDLLQYAAFEEPDEWEFAGFARFARDELRRRKPRKRRV